MAVHFFVMTSKLRLLEIGIGLYDALKLLQQNIKKRIQQSQNQICNNPRYNNMLLVNSCVQELNAYTSINN